MSTISERNFLPASVVFLWLTTAIFADVAFQNFMFCPAKKEIDAVVSESTSVIDEYETDDVFYDAIDIFESIDVFYDARDRLSKNARRRLIY